MPLKLSDCSYLGLPRTFNNYTRAVTLSYKGLALIPGGLFLSEMGSVDCPSIRPEGSQGRDATLSPLHQGLTSCCLKQSALHLSAFPRQSGRLSGLIANEMGAQTT